MRPHGLQVLKAWEIVTTFLGMGGSFIRIGRPAVASPYQFYNQLGGEPIHKTSRTLRGCIALRQNTELLLNIPTGIQRHPNTRMLLYYLISFVHLSKLL